MPGRTWQGTADEYRYEFNDKETDKELNSGASDFGMREYDSRIGRFYSRDPFARFFPNKTPYAPSGNSPILFGDNEGGFQIIPGISAQGKNYRALVNVVKAVSRMANENNGNNEFVNTFMLMSGVSREKALEVLTYGSGPLVVATNNDAFIGSTVPGRKVAGRYRQSMCVNGEDLGGICDFVFINDDLLSSINNSSDGRPSVMSNIIALVTLWHEGMHYADYLDLSTQPPNSAGEDIGTQAENILFGFIPNYDNLTNFYKTKIRGASPTPLNQNYFLGTNSAINNFWSKYNHGGSFNQSYSLDLKELGKTIGNIAKKVGNFIKGIFKGGQQKSVLKKSGASF
jgi:RHS repeat-associated protein